jgi:hypothetical protein
MKQERDLKLPSLTCLLKCNEFVLVEANVVRSVFGTDQVETFTLLAVS